jgi:hypothetical protein
MPGSERPQHGLSRIAADSPWSQALLAISACTGEAVGPLGGVRLGGDHSQQLPAVRVGGPLDRSRRVAGESSEDECLVALSDGQGFVLRAACRRQRRTDAH